VIKSAEDDGLAEIDDLLDPGCPVEWIITKSALQEGWDCPFAYILVSLSSTGSGQSMTQLVGRVLRQPYQERTNFDELNESYIFCLHKRSDAIAREVKGALENEGYEGDAAAVVDASRDTVERLEKEIRIRQSLLELYQRPFEGKIYLPRFCVKKGRNYEPLDYFRHLVSHVDVAAFEYRQIDWKLSEEVRAAKDRFFSITLGEGLSRQYERDIDYFEPDEQVLGWLAASLKFDYLSHKQLRYVVGEVYEQLLRVEIEKVLRGRLTLVKFVVRDKIQAFVQDQIDRQTKEAFAALHEEGKLQFYLMCAECRFEIPDSIKIYPTRPLTHNGEVMKRSLFDYVDDEAHNEYEREVAICLDQDANVLWWYRNLVAKDQFAIQGYKRERLYPDFVVQKGTERPQHTVLVLESKGKHLEGNPDTTYKRNVAEYFEEVGRRVSWQQLGEGFKDHVFRFQILDEAHDFGRDWKDQLRDLLRE
jgi:type III restriction enzyme